MRTSILVFSLLGFCAAVPAQVTVPNTFAAGAPAKAADVNANFQALVNGINALGSRVSKLEGQIVASDLVGTYSVNQFQSELGAGSRVATYTGGGTATFAANGTGTISGNTELGHQLNLPGGTLAPINRPQAPSNFTWNLSSGTLTALGATFSVVAGGQLLITTSTNPLDGTNVILLLTRTN